MAHPVIRELTLPVASRALGRPSNYLWRRRDELEIRDGRIINYHCIFHMHTVFCPKKKAEQYTGRKEWRDSISGN